MGRRLRQLDPRKPSVAITLALGTFHTVLLVLIGVALVYFFGDLGDGLDGLNTFAGLGLFAYLWVITWVTAAGALQRLGWPRRFPIERVMEAAALWGGFTGAAVLAIPAGILAVAIVVVGIATFDGNTVLAALVVLPFGVIGSVVAFAVGAMFGMAFGLIDTLLFGASLAGLGRNEPGDDAL